MSKNKFAEVKAEYAERWASMRVTSQKADIDALARIIVENKSTYLLVQAATNVPWYVVGILHARESSCNFKKHLHNGDSLRKRTVNVPAGRPLRPQPPYDFQTSAIDALKMKGFHTIAVWSVERICFSAETYNGFGYRNHGYTNPYLWSGTNHYTKGKYVRDHVIDPSHVDEQVGVMPLLKRVSELDPSFALKLEADKKGVVETIRKSKSLGAQLNGFIALLVAFFAAVWDWIVNFGAAAWHFVENLIGVLPSASQSAQTAVVSAEQLAVAARVPWPTIAGIALGGLCLLYAVVRETPKKRVS